MSKTVLSRSEWLLIEGLLIGLPLAERAKSLRIDPHVLRVKVTTVLSQLPTGHVTSIGVKRKDDKS
jgi:hypothetical protein